jgi:hypothetical protein
MFCEIFDWVAYLPLDRAGEVGLQVCRYFSFAISGCLDFSKMHISRTFSPYPKQKNAAYQLSPSSLRISSCVEFPYRNRRRFSAAKC